MVLHSEDCPAEEVSVRKGSMVISMISREWRLPRKLWLGTVVSCLKSASDPVGAFQLSGGFQLAVFLTGERVFVVVVAVVICLFYELVPRWPAHHLPLSGQPTIFSSVASTSSSPQWLAHHLLLSGSTPSSPQWLAHHLLSSG